MCDEGKGELQLAGRNPFCCGTSSIPFPVECGLGLPAVVRCPTGLIGIPPVHWIFFFQFNTYKNPNLSDFNSTLIYSIVWLNRESSILEENSCHEAPTAIFSLI